MIYMWIAQAVGLGFLIIVISLASYLLIINRARFWRFLGFVLFVLVPFVTGLIIFNIYNDILKAQGLMDNKGVITATKGGGYREVDWTYYWKPYPESPPIFHFKSKPDEYIPANKKLVENNRALTILVISVVPSSFIWYGFSRGKLPKLLLFLIGVGVSMLGCEFAFSNIFQTPQIPILLAIFSGIIFSCTLVIMVYGAFYYFFKLIDEITW